MSCQRCDNGCVNLSSLEGSSQQFDPFLVPGTPTTDPIVSSSCGETLNAEITDNSQTASFRTGDAVENLSYRARQFTFQATEIGVYTITVTTSEFVPFVTLFRDFDTRWNTVTNPSTNEYVLEADVTSGNIGPVTLEITTQAVGARGSFECHIECPNGTGTFLFAQSLVTGTTLSNDLRVDEFGFWRRVLSDAEIAALWNGGAGVTYPTVPVTVAGYWKMEEANGTRFDSVGSNNLTQGSISPIDVQAGIQGQAAHFGPSTIEAEGRSLQKRNSSTFGYTGGSFSFVFWLRYTTIGSAPIAEQFEFFYLIKDSTGAVRATFRFLVLETPATFFLSLTDDITGTITLSPPDVIVNNTWYMITFFYDASDGKIGFRLNDAAAVKSATGIVLTPH